MGTDEFHLWCGNWGFSRVVLDMVEWNSSFQQTIVLIGLELGQMYFLGGSMGCGNNVAGRTSTGKNLGWTSPECLDLVSSHLGWFVQQKSVANGITMAFLHLPVVTVLGLLVLGIHELGDLHIHFINVVEEVQGV